MKRLTSFIQHIPSLHSSLMRAFVFLLMLIQYEGMNANFSKHSTSIATKITGRWSNSTYPHTNLTSDNANGPDINSIYYTGNMTNVALDGTDRRNYINVTLNDQGLKDTDEGDVVIYVRRSVNIASGSWTMINNAQPTEFEVKALYPNPSGGNYITSTPVFYVSLQYRGPSTEEYSVRIPIKKIFENYPLLKGKTVTGLRFFVTKTNNDALYDVRNNKLRETALNSFDVLKIAHDAPYSDTFIDNFHLMSDYLTSFSDYKFINTRGIADSRNSIDGWEMLNDDEIKRLKDLGITYPDFNFITSESDKKRNPYPLNAGEKRQPTHTIEHIVYAMPGDVVPLYPYTAMPRTTNFHENFSHWYDYKTGGHLQYKASWSDDSFKLLDFLGDPSEIQKSNENGFFGGQNMNLGSLPIFYVSTVQEYVEAVEQINTSVQNACIELTADLDFSQLDGVPPIICPGWEKKFSGMFNGNGHRISNFVIDNQGLNQVGLIGWTNRNVVIANLILDSSCRFIGNKDVALIGFHAEGPLTVKNIHTEATFKAAGGQAAAIVGESDKVYNSISIVDCYIGGEIGFSNRSDNAALIGWQKETNGENVFSFKNIIVDCKLSGSDSNPYRKYIRSGDSNEVVSTLPSGIRVKKSFRFENCYGYLDSSDECWNNITQIPSFTTEQIAALGWVNYSTPPMSSSVNTTGFSAAIKITDEADYIAKVKAFNNNAVANNESTLKSHFELTRDLDFKDYGPDEVPMIGESKDKEFAGLFNGAGHVIKNLRIVRDREDVGMFGLTRNGARIENLIIDSSCLFEGSRHVGIVGNHRWNPLTFRNVKTEATVRASAASGEKCASGILGYNFNNYSENMLTLENVYIGGIIGYPTDNASANNSVICGWVRDFNVKGTHTYTNIVVDCKLYGGDNTTCRKYIRHSSETTPVTLEGNTYVKKFNDNYQFRYLNCYGILDANDIPWQQYELAINMEEMPEFESWVDSRYPNMTLPLQAEYIVRNINGKGNRKPGTMATFFCPLNPFENQNNQSIPFQPGESEYVIAADFSQTFSTTRNIDVEAKEIYEPIVAFRHIFRIRDAKAYADDMSGSKSNNENFLRRNRKFITAPQLKPIQIRLDNPVPRVENWQHPRSHLYYVNQEGEYREIPQIKVRVLNADNRTINNSINFTFSGQYTGYGRRFIEGLPYAVGEACYSTEEKYQDYDSKEIDPSKEYEYYRTLNATVYSAGHYIVQLLAYDYNGNVINIKGTSDPLVVMEYDLTVIGMDGAKISTHEQLYDADGRKSYRPEELDKTYGKPTVKIDFDEYMVINNLHESDPLKSKLISRSSYYQSDWAHSQPGEDTHATINGIDQTWFKWPVPWEQSTYSFGYDDRHDYSMYQLATHSENVVWKWSANDYPEQTSATSSRGNKAGDGTGLYDRKYYASRWADAEAIPEQGYFYYVNAASDPGVTASLRIDELCQGSRIIVSAWMAEFSSLSEKADLSFNFVAVLKDNLPQQYLNDGFVNGERVVLNQFLTGKVDDAGKWYNVYYSFVPRLAEFSSKGVSSDIVDHYELELENNAKTSNGADYAVDDIRAYVVPPVSEVKQLSPACEDSEMRIKISSPFYTLLELARTPEAIGDMESKSLGVYYAILDKERYKEVYDNGGSHEVAFNASVIEFNNDDTHKTYDKLIFKSRYTDNPAYTFNPNREESETGFSETEDGQKMIAFESETSAGSIRLGKTYYFILKCPMEDEANIDGNEATFFDMTDKCANVSEITILHSSVIKLGGIEARDPSALSVCENQYPVIQVNILGTDDDSGDMKPAEKNARMDWFYGTMNEFDDYTEEGNEDHTLKDALAVFRYYYPETESLVGVVPKPSDGKMEPFEQWMIDLLKKATTPENGKSFAVLSLNQSSYVMPPFKIPEGQTEGASHVVVIPAKYDYGNFVVCYSPVELTVTAQKSSPSLKHGLTDIPYPSDLADVPLRIGVDQLKTNLTELTGQQPRKVDIPVRDAASSDGKSSKKLKLISQDVHAVGEPMNSTNPLNIEGAVFLVQTNDPDYKDLGTKDKDGNDIEGLSWVGDIKKLEAVTNNENITQYFQVLFDNSFNFREGYFYKFLFQFEEDGSANNENVCNGQDVFTLKIVPRYVAWTGESSLNWNDDGNWRRVAGTSGTGKNDLQITSARTNTLAHYVTNGSQGYAVNRNTTAYAPLDFTNVIVEKGMEAPFMYHPAEERLGANAVKDEYVSGKTYTWPSNPEKGAGKIQGDDPEAEGVGAVTPLIHFDMAAFEFDASNRRETAEIGCRPWYANTCNEIHFKPGGTIMNQQELVYNKAWVDVELDHSRWQTLSTPLKEVYAGDFYLPSNDAREFRELYTDITFDNERKRNDRFKPAVFQRGWDKATANVYEIDALKNEVPGARNVAIRTFWSHVYNDVKEQYGSGNGFSIKTDVSAMTSNQPGTGDKVLFRLPKADTEYLYWNKDGSKSGHKTEIARTDGLHHRLNDSNGTLTVTSAGKCNYFLVGNPFMTHMDIRKFLDVNKDQLEQKYWVITETGQIAGGVDGDNNFFAADPTDTEWAEDPTVIAPMQGFFVKTKELAEKVELAYDESLMRRYDSRSENTGEYLTGTTRAEAGNTLRIVAESDGYSSTAALLRLSEGADTAWNVEAIDNRDLDIPAIVYTAGGGHALSIQSVREAEGIEVGVIADEDRETYLIFSGIDEAEGLMLLDKADRSLTPVSEGLEVRVEGQAAGRFFLTYGIADEGVMSGIEWSVSGRELTVTDCASSGRLEVSVYDTLGRCVERGVTDKDVVALTLDPGIYVVEMKTAKECRSVKIRI